MTSRVGCVSIVLALAAISFTPANLADEKAEKSPGAGEKTKSSWFSG